MRTILRFLICLLAFPYLLWSSEQTDLAYKSIEEHSKVKILSPTLAEQKTAKIELTNGLEVYLISDPKLTQSGASLSIKAGSWMDPDAFPGLAHFLEHMLFLGTAKYPDESSFDAFISEHGGQTNAFTASDFTSFVFSIDNSAFVESLDRFSSFFKEPLFNPSGVSRELHAIDQEYAKNIENDEIRLISVLNTLGNKGHPNSRFSMGNSETLQNVSRETFIDWYKNHYSANLMRLVVLSNLPIDQLKELVINDFQGIANANLNPAPIEKILASDETKNKLIYITPIKNIQKLYLIWELPPELYDVRQDQAPAIVCHVLGEESSHSLLTRLKKENLADSIDCQSIEIGGRNQELFIEIGLTTQGVEKVNRVIESIFQFIHGLQKKGIPEYLFKEIKMLADINYRYQSSEAVFSTMMMHAGQLINADFAGYPETEIIPQQYNPEAIAKVLNALSSDRAIIALMAPATLTGVPTNLKEKWLGGQYAVKPIPSETLALWRNPGNFPDFQLPPPNPFIPENLTLYNGKPASENTIDLIPRAEKIIDNDSAAIYYCPDNYFGLPQVSLLLNIKTPQVDIGIANKIVMADLYVELLNNALAPLNYPATNAGLEYKIERNKFGIGISINGFNDKAPLLYDKILGQMKSITFNEEKFKISKETLLRQYQNSALESPLHQAQEVLKSVLFKKYASPKSLSAAIKKVSFESFNEYTYNLFSKAYVEGMFYGNLTEEQARAFADQVISTLKAQPYPKKNHLKQEVIVLPQNKGPFYLESTTKVQGNAIILAIANGDYAFKTRAAQQILMEAVGEPFYSTLRTQQQTGYLVDSSAYEVEMHLFCLFLAQTSTHDPRDLLARFELFIESFMKKGTNSISEESFNNIRKALLNKLTQPAKNMNEMGKLLNLIAFTYNGDFDWLKKRIEAFDKLTYAEFLSLSQEMLGTGNRKQLAILIKGAPGPNQGFHFTHLKSPQILRKLSTYTAPKKLTPH